MWNFSWGHFSGQSPGVRVTTGRRAARGRSSQPQTSRRPSRGRVSNESGSSQQQTAAVVAQPIDDEGLGSDDEASVGTQNVIDGDDEPVPVTTGGILEANPGQANEEGFVAGQLQMTNRVTFVKNDFGRGSIKEFRGLEPYDIVMLLWKDVMVHVVNCFNLRLEQQGLNLPRLSCGQLEAWHGCRIVMGLVRMPQIQRYFQDGPVCCGASAFNLKHYISLNRFQEIKRNLVFENYAVKNPTENPLLPADKIWKVRTIVTKVKERFKRFMPAPGEHLSADEAMVLFTGNRCPIIRAMPNKPITRGIKLYMGVDYETKFAFDFNVCDGSITAENSTAFPYGATGRQIVKLLEGLVGMGYKVYVDNYYTSIPLATELLSRHIYLIGTLRKDRGVPSSVVVGTSKKPKPSKKFPKGFLKCAYKADKSMCVYGLMDNSVVYLLDTFYGSQELINMPRKQKQNGAVANLVVPPAVDHYNKKMGGVDQIDQIRTGDYGIDNIGRASKWTVRLYEALFNLCLANSYNAYRYLKALDGEQVDHFDFNASVAKKMLDNPTYMVERTPTSLSKRTRSTANLDYVPATAEEKVRELVLEHAICEAAPGSRGEIGGRRRERGRCIQCKTSFTSYYCVSCSEAHPQRETMWMHPECYKPFHRSIIENDFDLCSLLGCIRTP